MKKALILILTAFICGLVSAARIGNSDARRCAANWLHRNGIAAGLFADATINDVVAYDADANLWIAELSPSGYIVLSGSDLRKPVVAFSQNDFDWSDEESPFFAQLVNSAAATAEAEAVGGTRHKDWASLLGGIKLKAAVPPETLNSKIVVKPFMTDLLWNQCQPFNDFSPVYIEDSAEVVSDAYRGRVPCGCMATAFAQVLAYWYWPFRFGDTRTYVHKYYPKGDNVVNDVVDFTIRFDGNLPFDWLKLDAWYYYWYDNSCELRGKIAENNRFPVARLILFADNVSQMNFATNGSEASLYPALTTMADFYTMFDYENIVDKDYQQTADEKMANMLVRIKADLRAARPVPVSIPGHAIIAHGFAEDGNDTYLYYNYGWGGQGDGWYLASGGEEKEELKYCYTGFYPRKIVQTDPIPAVVDNSVNLSWHLPICYADEVTGFEISKIEVGDDVVDVTNDFTVANGFVLDESRGGVGTRSGVGNSTPLLYLDPSKENSYICQSVFPLTTRSELSFRLMSTLAIDSVLTIRARIDGKDWTILDTQPLREDGYIVDEWKTIKVFLGDKGGSDIQLRFDIVRTGTSYYGVDWRAVCIDDVCVSDVLKTTESVQTVSPSDRSLTVENLESGRVYNFAVKPLFGEDGGERSLAVRTQTAGTVRKSVPAVFGKPSSIEWENVTYVREANPEILSVSGSSGYPQVAEDFYRENAIGENVIWVKCSHSVTELMARPSHLSLVGDDDVEVHSRGNGVFAVVIRADAAKVPNRSRMILTLEARNANGTAAFKDLSLRFDLSEPAETYVAHPTVVDVETTDFGGVTTIGVPVSWFVDNHLAQADADADRYAQLAEEDSDGDGFSNLTEYVCGTNPLDATDRLTCFIRIVDGSPKVTHSATNLLYGFRAVVKGVNDLRQLNWQSQSTTHRFFKVVIESGIGTEK